MSDLPVLLLVGALLLAGIALDRLVRRPPRRGSKDQRLAEHLDAQVAHDVDLVETLVSQGWLWPRCAGGTQPQRRLETSVAVRHPANHPHVEVVGTIVRSHALRGAAADNEFNGGSVALARLPASHEGHALFVEGGAVPDAMESWLRRMPKVADLCYVDQVAEAAHGVDPLLDLAWSAWSSDADDAREWLAADQTLREALRAAAPRGIRIGRGVPDDPVQERHPSGAAGRALRNVRAIEVRGQQGLVVSSGAPPVAAAAAEAFVSLLQTNHRHPDGH